MIKILCSGDYYVIDGPYKRGALAFRSGLDYNCNPYKDEDRARQWERGFMFEREGEHNKLGIVVILATYLYKRQTAEI